MYLLYGANLTLRSHSLVYLISRFWRVMRRVAGALSERLILPGAGACEVVCASTLELEAARCAVASSIGALRIFTFVFVRLAGRRQCSHATH